jgi:PGM1 C-terminal domain
MPTQSRTAAPSRPQRQFVLPTVHALATPTAHPSAEAWRDHEERFAALQQRMAHVEAVAHAGREPRTAVVIPSRSGTATAGRPAAETQAYEERLLCTLLELRDPRLHLVYVTSSPVSADIVSYYLSLLPAPIRRDARARLKLVAAGDRSRRALSEKLLERHDALALIRRSVRNSSASHLVPYTTTTLERDLALALDLPMYGADPSHAHLGTKSGCRRLFARAGVPHPAGVEGVHSFHGAVAAIARLRASHPHVSEMVIKLDEGVAGEGNGIIDLAGLPAPGAPGEAALIAQRLAATALEEPTLSPDAYFAALRAGGGIVEERICAEELRSPSVQLEVSARGEVRVLSTHDQILGGASGQRFLGCRFPADSDYAPAISELARRIGDHLARVGVIGRFAVDFVVARRPGGVWQPYAIEVNLRKGGTTHPYHALTQLTGGAYAPESASFTTAEGQSKYYAASDHLEAPQLRALGRRGVLALARRTDLRFDRTRGTGVVFHMLSSLDELGRTGFTAIADTRREADLLYEHVHRVLLGEADRRCARAHHGARARRRRPARRPSSVPMPAPAAAGA